MPTPPPFEGLQSLRVPTVRYIVIGCSLLVLSLLALGGSRTETYQNMRYRIGVGSDGEPTTWFGGKKHDGSQAPRPPPQMYDDEIEAANVTLVNATFVILARNSDVWEIISSIRGMEDRFNRKYHYPYVFLNDEPFSDEFKRHTSGIASGPCTYGLIPKNQWGEEPEWIDQEKAAAARKSMEEKKVIYGGSISYRHMCRYQSGFFFRHPLLDPYKYYWRIEPNVKYFCDIDYDPFKVMEQGKKKYGFTVTIYEYIETIETLWETTKAFMKEYPQFISKPNTMRWISPDGGDTYNRCHFWSNFELGDLDFWRSEPYITYFEYLDKAGGFFYERWGDAPVHSIAAALFLKPDEIEFFHDIGYRHEPFQHCPQGLTGKCACNPEDTFETHWYSCTPAWKSVTQWAPSKHDIA